MSDDGRNGVLSLFLSLTIPKRNRNGRMDDPLCDSLSDPSRLVKAISLSTPFPLFGSAKLVARGYFSVCFSYM